MDPLSIVTTIGAVAQTGRYAWGVASELVNLIKDARNVDETVSELASEVEYLAGTCDLVRTQLEDITSSIAADPNWKRSLGDAQSARLWICVDTQISGCNKAIRALARSISSVRAQRNGFVRQVSRQFQLNLKEGEIATIRSQIGMSVSGLQLSMQAIIIKISFLAPKQAAVEVTSKIDKLQDGIEKQNRRLRALHTDLVTDRNQFKLLSVAEDVLFDADAVKDLSTSHESTGHGQGYESSLSIAETEVPQFRRSSMTQASSETQVSTRDFESTESDSEPESPESPYSFEDIAVIEDDFEKEVLERTRSLGHEAYEHGDYHKAERHYSDVTTLEGKANTLQRQESDNLDTKYHLAMCALHTKNIMEAESILLDYLDQPVESDIDAIRLHDIGHELSQVYIHLGKLNLASTLAEQTVRGRRNLLSSKHDHYHESLALLSRIYTLRGDEEHAEVYATMVDEEKKEMVFKLFQDLQITEPQTRRSSHDLAGQPGVSLDRIFDEQQDHWLSALGIEAAGPIEDAIAGRCIDEAMRLIESADGNSSKESKDSKNPKSKALHLAALFGDHGIVKSLLQHGFDHSALCQVRLKDEVDELQPLHLAIAARRNDVVCALVKAGASLDKRSRRGYSPAVFILSKTRLRVVDSRPEEILPTLETLKSLDFDLSSKLDSQGRTLLHLVFTIPDIQSETRRAVIQFLLDNKANVLRKNRNGFRPIHSCLYSNRTREDVALLLQYKPRQQVNAITYHGNTALHIALSHRDSDRSETTLNTMHTLLDAGADANSKTFFKMSPLKYARETGDKAAIELLERY